jgi:hypothetical protein
MTYVNIYLANTDHYIYDKILCTVRAEVEKGTHDINITMIDISRFFPYQVSELHSLLLELL